MLDILLFRNLKVIRMFCWSFLFRILPILTQRDLQRRDRETLDFLWDRDCMALVRLHSRNLPYHRMSEICSTCESASSDSTDVCWPLATHIWEFHRATSDSFQCHFGFCQTARTTYSCRTAKDSDRHRCSSFWWKCSTSLEWRRNCMFVSCRNCAFDDQRWKQRADEYNPSKQWEPGSEDEEVLHYNQAVSRAVQASLRLLDYDRWNKPMVFQWVLSCSQLQLDNRKCRSHES